MYYETEENLFEGWEDYKDNDVYRHAEKMYDAVMTMLEGKKDQAGLCEKIRNAVYEVLVNTALGEIKGVPVSLKIDAFKCVFRVVVLLRVAKKKGMVTHTEYRKVYEMLSELAHMLRPNHLPRYKRKNISDREELYCE